MFCCYQREKHKMSHFWHFKDNKFGSKHDNYQMNLFFLCTLWALSLNIFHFYISRHSKFNSMRSLLCILFWFVKYIFTSQKDTFKPVNKYILFQCKTSWLLVYNRLCFQFDTSLVQIPWTVWKIARCIFYTIHSFFFSGIQSE